MSEVQLATAAGSHEPEELHGEDIVREAVAYATRKMGWETTEDTVAAVRRGDLQTYSYFRYALAREFSRVLGRLNNTIRESYLFFENECISFPGEPIQLGLIVTRKTAALQSLVDILGAATLDAVRVCLGCADGFTVFFHTELLDAEAVAAKTGLAAIIGSLYQPPLRVWPFPG
jgi:hypothetical protein